MSVKGLLTLICPDCYAATLLRAILQIFEIRWIYCVNRYHIWRVQVQTFIVQANSFFDL